SRTTGSTVTVMHRRIAFVVLALLSACSSRTVPPSRTTTTVTTSATSSSTTATTVPAVGLTAADVPASWRPGCPVPPSQLRRVTVDFWGFDDQPHTGTLVVNARVVSATTKVFATLYTAHFPIRKMEPIDAYGGDDERSLDADNTAGFNCRRVVGGSGWSKLAYGLAIDVDPIENAYV